LFFFSTADSGSAVAMDDGASLRRKVHGSDLGCGGARIEHLVLAHVYAHCGVLECMSKVHSFFYQMQ
jgi:hypothetical protein